MTEEGSQALPAYTIPLAGSLLLTGAVSFLIVTPLRPHSLTWASLFAYSILFIATAAIAHAFAVWILCLIFREQIGSPTLSLITTLWMAAAWLPVLALLFFENSPWVAAILPIIVGSAALYLKRRKPDPHNAPGLPESTLFRFQEPPPLARAILPALLAAITVQAAVASLVWNEPLLAGILFSTVAPMSLQAFPASHQAPGNRQPNRNLINRSVLVLILTAIALIPFLQHSHLARASGPRSAPTTQPRATKPLAPGSDYSGVILTLPPKPHPEIVPPAPQKTSQPGTRQAKPVVIPFDGVYWYFKPPQHRPKPDARTVRGDPAKANVRSTDYLPLAMEAHQSLGTPMTLDCCKSIRLALQNADTRLGTISVEILLGNTLTAKDPQESLGTVVIPSSQAQTISLTRPPVNETLLFRIASTMNGKLFNEIVVRIKPSRERAGAGAHIAVQHFELVP